MEFCSPATPRCSRLTRRRVANKIIRDNNAKLHHVSTNKSNIMCNYNSKRHKFAPNFVMFRNESCVHIKCNYVWFQSTAADCFESIVLAKWLTNSSGVQTMQPPNHNIKKQNWSLDVELIHRAQNKQTTTTADEPAPTQSKIFSPLYHSMRPAEKTPTTLSTCSCPAASMI